MGSWIFFRTSLVPFITYILVIKIGWTVFKILDFLIFQNSFITFVRKFFSSWYLGWIYLVMGATYPRNIDQFRTRAPRPCLSCYGLCFIDFNRNFTIKMNNSQNVSWRFKFYELCHLIVKLRFNVIETNLYDWKVPNATQQSNDLIGLGSNCRLKKLTD